MKLLKFNRIFIFLLITVAVAYIAFIVYAITQYKNYKHSTVDLGKVIYLNHTIIKTTNNTTFARCRGFFDFDCIDIEVMDIEIGCQLYEHKTFTHTLYSCD
jgi:hypothetical protein